MDNKGREGSVARLAGARMPADHGLASLGLIMQLTGSLFMGVGALAALTVIFAGGGGDAWMIFLIGALAAVRSGFHRAAGTALIYGGPQGSFRPLHAYIVVAGLQTAATLFLTWYGGLHLGLSGAASVAIMLMAWPATLAFVRRIPRIAALGDEVPMAEDNGFEGVAVLMALLGAAGCVFAGLVLLLLFKLPSEALRSPHALLALGVFGMLLARSVMHTIAGVKGSTGIDADGATESASRYFSFGVVSSVIAGAVLSLQFMMTTMQPVMLVVTIAVVYLLLAWPLAVRRFFTERNFSTFLAGDEAPIHRRAPDAGLTALGWLLLALGVLGLSTSLPAALFGSDALELWANSSSGLGHSSFWSVGLAALQLWAGIELTSMSDRSKTAATVYGAVSTAVSLYLFYPLFTELESLGGPGGLGMMGPGFLETLIYGEIIFALVIPVGTLILVHRALTPVATARLRDDAA